MNLRRVLYAGVLLLGTPNGFLHAAEADNQVANIESSMANRIEPIVKELGGVSKAWVWVKIEPDLDRWSAFMKMLAATKGAPRTTPAPRSQLPRSIDILPGVSTDEMAGLLKGREQSIANGVTRADAARSRAPDYDAAIQMASWFRRVSVRVAVPESIAPERLNDLKQKLPVLIGLRAPQGDNLIVETFPDALPLGDKAPSAPERFRAWISQMSPNMAALWICLLAAIGFIFGPIRTFLRDAAGAMQTIRVQTQSSGTIENKSRISKEESVKAETVEKTNLLPGQNLLALAAGADGQDPELANGEASGKPADTRDLFAFLTEEMVPNLIQLCQEETPEHIAMLASYIKSTWAGRLLSSLSPAKRQDVLSHFSHDSRFDPTAVTAFANGLKQTIYFVSGGPDRLLELLEEMEPVTKNAVLLELDRLLPETAHAVRAKLITFIDLFRLPRKDLQKLLWEGYRAHIALPVLIASVSEKGRQYLIKQLPESIAAVIAHEVVAVGTPPFERVDSEGRRLLHLARTLEKSGEIGSIANKTIEGQAA